MVDDCDDTSDHPGKLQECPADKNNGCFMTEGCKSVINYYLLPYSSKVSEDL